MRARLGILGVVVVLATSACGLLGAGGRMQAIAVFDDVADMARGAPVQLADVRIGEVSDIRIADDGRRAEVTLSFARSAMVPRAVVARVRRTSALGEKFVELRPTTDDLSAPLLEDGDRIDATEIVPDVEQLVGSGTDVFAAISASQLAVLIDEGAKGFGGKGPQLRQVLQDFDTIASGYRTRTASIETLIRSIDDLASDLGPSAASHADALSNLAETTTILDDESQRLLGLLDSLNDLAVQAGSIITEHRTQIDRQIDLLVEISRVLAGNQSALERLLTNLPLHNEVLDLGIKDDFVQVLNDFIVCGLPGGGEDTSEPLNSCGSTEGSLVPAGGGAS